MSLHVPITQDIWHLHQHKFSPVAQSFLNASVKNTIVEYDDTTDALRAPHDPYPDKDWAVKKLGWEPEKVDLYRTLCRLGLEYEWIRRLGQVKYFGCVLDQGRSDDDAVDALIKLLEPFAQHGYIMGSLLKLSKMDLMDRYNSNNSTQKVVVTYIALNEPGLHHLSANPTRLEFQEGGMPYKLP